jgi:hypothetical protein
MTNWKLPLEGACRCGQVRIRVSAPPLVTMACHCTGCQKMSSSAYSLSAGIPAQGFEVIAGEPVVGGLHGASKHYFCPYCMSWMFTRPEGMDWFVNIRPTMLDEPGRMAPFIETWTSEKLGFAQTGAVHSYDALPPMDAYEGLMQEYREWAER